MGVFIMANLNNRHFGCEIEMSTPFEDCKKIITPIIKKIYGPRSIKSEEAHCDTIGNYKYWHLKEEPSSESELCTPISTWKNIGNIQNVIKQIQKTKIKITRNDSVHVHVQANDVDPRNILSAWLFYESTIKKCFPKHRRINENCPGLIKEKGKHKNIAYFLINAILESESHKSIISFHNYEERKTVEFRISEGSLDQNHIRNWILFCLTFINTSKKIDPILTICQEVNSTDIDDLIIALDIKDKKLSEWLETRYNKFKRNY